eukprot:GHVQ01041198.1.p1 GENE.GHVQ01041198.1~~GHVQ01041198.1.p1  ORF type:complete len:261 (-),score=28.07 GHVQ01041198.1:1348-2130(-)
MSVTQHVKAVNRGKWRVPLLCSSVGSLLLLRFFSSAAHVESTSLEGVAESSSHLQDTTSRDIPGFTTPYVTHKSLRINSNTREILGELSASRTPPRALSTVKKFSGGNVFLDIYRGSLKSLGLLLLTVFAFHIGPPIYVLRKNNNTMTTNASEQVNYPKVFREGVATSLGSENFIRARLLTYFYLSLCMTVLINTESPGMQSVMGLFFSLTLNMVAFLMIEFHVVLLEILFDKAQTRTDAQERSRRACPECNVTAEETEE